MSGNCFKQLRWFRIYTRRNYSNEFSADAEMTDVRDESVSIEQAVVNYINRRIGQDLEWRSMGGNTIGPGVLMLDGSSFHDRKSDPDTNDITSVELLTVNNIDATTTDTDNPTVNTLSNINGTVNVNGTVTHVGDTTTTGDVTQTGDNTIQVM